PPPDGRTWQEQARTRSGFFTTSYSALKRAQGGGFVSPVRSEGLGDGVPDDQLDSADVESGFAVDLMPVDPTSGEREASQSDAPLELSRGRISGRFLHGLLEEVRLATLTEAPTLAAWSALPEIAALFERMRRRYDRPLSDVPVAQRLVHAALTVEVPLGPSRLPGFAHAARVLRELEFLYPIPEVGHRLLGLSGLADADDRKFHIGRGLIKGYIDLLFEHEGRVYLCDWKGDWLPGWSAAEVAAHVDVNYALQAQLYTLGVLRFLGIESEADFHARFGGVIYAFVRGMSAEQPGRGVHFVAPTFNDVLVWQDQLLAREAIGA
ncbi:MAG TPA: hypothetical protein VGG33_12330, partial [Polyangia bacterium]